MNFEKLTNFMDYMAGGLISIIEGMKFRDYVSSNIFEPLDIGHCVYHQTAEIQAKMAEQYSFIPEGENAGFDIVEAQKHGNAAGGVFVNVGKEVSGMLGEEYYQPRLRNVLYSCLD